MTHFTPNSLIAAVLASSRRDASLPENLVLSASFGRHRERDLGVGYGRSSGYASTSRRHYGESTAPSLIRIG